MLAKIIQIGVHVVPALKIYALATAQVVFSMKIILEIQTPRPKTGAMGTTGTIMGVSKYLKEQNPKIEIVGTQPTDGSKIPGIRRWSPEMVPDIFDASRVDTVLDVSQEEATTMARRMAKEEGILAGMSSGGALTAAIKLANQLDSGTIVCITCDRGDRYLSTDLFAETTALVLICSMALDALETLILVGPS